MSAPIDNGGPAFPEVTTTYTRDGAQDTQYVHSEGGMSLRDYFAAKAMHQMLHGAVIPHGFDASKELRMLADRAYEVADAMLAERSAS